MVAGQDVGYPIAEAARRLGLTPGAVRKRIRRGTLLAYKGLDGQWHVPVPQDNPRDTPAGDDGQAPAYDAAQDAAQDAGQATSHPDQTALYERLIEQQASEIAHLRAELERERDRAARERERADTIIMHLSQRPIELQAPTPAAKGATQDVTTAEASAPAPPRRWWQVWRWTSVGTA